MASPLNRAGPASTPPDERSAGPPRPRQAAWRPEIDGLRAVAVVSVMLYHLHSPWLPGGFVGVDVFFAISGFVVTGSLADSRAGSVFAFIGEFYARRLARILPALVVMLIVTALLAVLFIPRVWLSALDDRTAKNAFFGLSNWALMRGDDPYFAPRAEFNAYAHTWSLGIEEQFYVLAPFLVYFRVRGRQRAIRPEARLAVLGLGTLAAASVAACVWASATHPTEAFYFIGFRLWELAFGSLLFLVTDRRDEIGAPVRPAPDWLPAAASWAGLLCIGVSFILADTARFPWPWAALPVAGTLLLIGGTQGRPAMLAARLLAASPAVWIGKRSYSLYLWHWPVYVLLRWTVGLETPVLGAVAVILTFALATVSYRWIEQPLRHHRWIEHQPIWFRIGAFAALPVVGLLLVMVLFDHRRSLTFSRVGAAEIDWYAGVRMPYADVGDRRCRVDIEAEDIGGGRERRFSPAACSGPKDPRTMYVFGDSHAGMISPLLEQLSADTGMSISLFLFYGCPYLDFMKPMQIENVPGCLAFNRATTARAQAAARPGDIVLLPSLRMMRYGDQWANFEVTDMRARMYGEQAMLTRRLAEEDAKAWIGAFAEKQLTIIFVAPTPIFRAPPFRCSDWFNRVNPICAGENQQPREELERLREPVIDSMRMLAALFPDVRIWDPFPLLCPDPVCRTETGGRPKFFDGDHLSGYGNKLIYPDFLKFVSGNRQRTAPPAAGP